MLAMIAMKNRISSYIVKKYHNFFTKKIVKNITNFYEKKIVKNITIFYEKKKNLQAKGFVLKVEENILSERGNAGIPTLTDFPKNIFNRFLSSGS